MCIAKEKSSHVFAKMPLLGISAVEQFSVLSKSKTKFFYLQGEEPDEDEVYALIAALKRLYAFSW